MTTPPGPGAAPGGGAHPAPGSMLGTTLPLGIGTPWGVRTGSPQGLLITDVPTGIVIPMELPPLISMPGPGGLAPGQGPRLRTRGVPLAKTLAPKVPELPTCPESAGLAKGSELPAASKTPARGLAKSPGLPPRFGGSLASAISVEIVD